MAQRSMSAKTLDRKGEKPTNLNIWVRSTVFIHPYVIYVTCRVLDQHASKIGLFYEARH